MEQDPREGPAHQGTWQVLPMPGNGSWNSAGTEKIADGEMGKDLLWELGVPGMGILGQAGPNDIVEPSRISLERAGIKLFARDDASCPPTTALDICQLPQVVCGAHTEPVSFRQSWGCPGAGEHFVPVASGTLQRWLVALRPGGHWKGE